MVFGPVTQDYLLGKEHLLSLTCMGNLALMLRLDRAGKWLKWLI
jgi:hypothetical protein